MLRLLFGIVCCAVITFPSIVLADPCGMVPPIYVGNTVPIARVGDQNTYVFFKDGVETFVIRPGFQGKVDEFGMLIPLPTVPALRKVSDHIFPHVAAATAVKAIEQGLAKLALSREELRGIARTTITHARGATQSLQRHGFIREPPGADD